MKRDQWRFSDILTMIRLPGSYLKEKLICASPFKLYLFIMINCIYCKDVGLKIFLAKKYLNKTMLIHNLAKINLFLFDVQI